MLMPAISRYMTREPHTLPSTSTVMEAYELMRINEVRHVPIIDGTKLVGLVDLAAVKALHDVPGVDLGHVEVADVMVSPATVWGSQSVDEVAEMMRDKKLDCVVVLGGHGVQGIFTATDALDALAEISQRATS